MFTYAKYIILDEMTPIVFPVTLQHSDVARSFRLPVTSAGQCTIAGSGITCYGKSISLGVESQPNDAALIEKMLGAFIERASHD